MKTLPKMGRPSVTGLNWEELGPLEYQRQLYRLRHPNWRPRRWSGLSPKLLGQAEYVRQWRQLRKEQGRV